MLLKSGAEVEATFGSRSLYEGDLILRVGSADINKAKTQQEILKYIDTAIPFIELPDLNVAALAAFFLLGVLVMLGVMVFIGIVMFARKWG